MNEYPFTVLIVDDSEGNILLVQAILEYNGIITDYVDNGYDALNRVKEKKYDCILLDIMMPGMDGLEVCKLLKSDKLTEEVPVIFITASNDIKMVSKAFEYGGVDYITKPFNVDEVYARIKTHIQLKHSQQRLKEELQTRKEIQKKLEESESKYRSLFENSKMAIGIASLDGRIIESNFAMKELLGCNEQEIMKTNIKSFYFDPPERDKFILELSESGFVKDKELELRKLSGEKIVCVLNSNFIFLNNESVVLYAIVDITKQKEAENNILKAIIETEEKERSFFAQELHDGLGPVLSTTKLYLQSISDAKTPQKGTYFLENATKSLEEAITTLTEISNKLSPHILKNFGLNSAINAFIEKLKNTTKISVFFDSNSNERFNNMIETTIFRIVTELIHNTLKYAKAGNIVIKVNKSEKKLILEYYDDGIGFNANQILLKSKGMGLFNIQNRIKTLNGNMTIESAPGNGFKFHSYFPILG